MAKLKSDDVFLHADVECQNSNFGKYCEIGKGSRILNVTMGDYSYCDRYADIANAWIGKFANIASFVRIGATDHPMDRASMHHFLYRSSDYWDDVEIDQDWFEKRASRRVTIGHDTWIGHNAQIKPEITIGHGAIVASGAVVTKDVTPFTIVAGVPATPMRERFDQKITERLVALSWWNWSHDQLRLALDDFRRLPISAFLEKYE